jgi:hypothetical protein
MLAAISLDAVRVLPKVQGWVVPDFIAVCREFAPTPATMYDAGLVVAPDLFEERAGARPARMDGDGPYRASGYLQGDFLMGDFGASGGLRARDALAKDASSLAFMRRPWTPIVVEPPPQADAEAARVEVPELSEKARAAGSDPRVIQESFGIDGARYRIATERPLLLVENEIFFPGWSSDRAGRAVRVNGLLRGWLLPAGTYSLKTRFRLERLGLFAAVSAVGVVAWILWLLWIAGATRRPKRAA